MPHCVVDEPQKGPRMSKTIIIDDKRNGTPPKIALILALALLAGCTQYTMPALEQTSHAATEQVVSQQVGREKPTGAGATRMERDLLGEKAVPADAYYGVQ